MKTLEVRFLDELPDTGYEGRRQYPGKTFAEVETNLQGNSTLPWDKARNATLDAWNRAEMALPVAADGDGR